jgi:hypothetical protein
MPATAVEVPEAQRCQPTKRPLPNAHLDGAAKQATRDAMLTDAIAKKPIKLN